MLLVAIVAAAAVLAVAAWGWFEAGWLRTRVVEVELAGVPAELDGLRIAHLSDLHLGVPSRGPRAVEEAVGWVASRRPDLVCVTGDLVSRRAGLPLLERLLRELGGRPGSVPRTDAGTNPRTDPRTGPGTGPRPDPGTDPGTDPGRGPRPDPGTDRGTDADARRCYVVLGNHDFADTRDPFSQRIDREALERSEGIELLTDESITVEVRGRRVQIVGVDPRTYARRESRPDALIDESTDLRILLCHFPGIARLIPPVFHLVLAGHYHAGQIVVPLSRRRRLRLAHLGARDVQGVFDYGPMKLHVSPGLGTTFVPFRLFARPEVTELVVRSAR